MKQPSSGYARPSNDGLGQYGSFVLDAEDEFAASAAREISATLPWIARIAKDRSPIEYEREPIAARPDAPLSVAQAAECAMQVSAVLAALHARGWVGLRGGARDVRVFREGERWRAEVIVPHMSLDEKWQTHRARKNKHFWALGAWQQDLTTVAGFFVDLLEGYVPEQSPIPRNAPEFAMPETIDERARSALSALLTGSQATRAPNDAAALAALFAALTADPVACNALIESLPRACPTELRRDWQRLCELGEEAIKRRSRWREANEHIAVSLANAHHQRAIELFNERSFSAALKHVERCLDLDRYSRYRITKGTIECAMLDYLSASATFTEAIASANREAASGSFGRRENPSRELARATYSRAIARWHAGKRSEARADLSTAADAIGPAMAVAVERGYSVPELRELEKLIRAAQAKLDAT